MSIHGFFMSNTIQSVAITSVGNGASLVAGVAGNVLTPVFAIKSLIAGAGITIDGSDRSSQVTISATGLPPLTSLVTAQVHWAAAVPPNNLPIFTAAYPMLITAIVGRVEVPTTNVASPALLMLVKAVDGVAISAGTPLISSYFRAGPPSTTNPSLGVAATNQSMDLIQDTTVIRLNVGDSIGVQAGGDWSNGSGGITIHMAPFPTSSS
jgi:hypothetical protein